MNNLISTISVILLAGGIIGCESMNSDHHKKGEMNKKFLDKNLDAHSWKRDFENTGRDVYKNREMIVKELNLKKGEYVADVGAGTGAFLSLLNDSVGPKGLVYAVEISPKFIEYMNERVKNNNLNSVKVVKGGFKSTNLKSKSVDVVLLVDVYHHLDEPSQMLEDFKRILKPGGKLVVVDYDKVPGKSRKWVMNHLRLNEKGYIDEISATGFNYLGKSNVPFKESFMLSFQKKIK